MLGAALHLSLVLAKPLHDVPVGIQHETTRKDIETGPHDLGDVRHGDVAARHQGPEAYVWGTAVLLENEPPGQLEDVGHGQASGPPERIEPVGLW